MSSPSAAIRARASGPIACNASIEAAHKIVTTAAIISLLFQVEICREALAEVAEYRVNCVISRMVFAPFRSGTYTHRMQGRSDLLHMNKTKDQNLQRTTTLID
jgi:hypothetical protein